MGHIFRNSLIHFVEKKNKKNMRGDGEAGKRIHCLAGLFREKKTKQLVHRTLLLLSYGRRNLQF